ncbi:ogr/Delta-like zinc finger family protein [Asticcacaulis sp.]|uniref:ogr/Delta-like zinc finger family protein n=1 Tax=Asticcacaulis sp. TaxID=1872648 RepID=UPI0039C89CB8
MKHAGAAIFRDRTEEKTLLQWVEGASPAFPCPVCQTKGHARTSEQLSRLVRKLYYRCFNPRCGHRWTAHLEYIATTTPSALGEVQGAVPLLNLKPRPTG